MHRKSIATLLSMILILTFVLTSCSQPTPTPVPAPTKAPAPAATQAPAPTAAPAATKAPEPTKAPAPTAAPVSKYKEAPILADQVKAGKLPLVDQRLPEKPYVINAPEIGQYGGVWRRGFLGPSDRNGLIRIVNDALVRFSIDGASVEMKYAESVTPNADFTQWTIKLRKGSKWSDGSAVHRGRHHVLVQGRGAEQGSHAVDPVLAAATRTAPRSRWRRWTTCRSSSRSRRRRHLLPARDRAEGCRRQELPDVPARALHEAVPCVLCRTRPTWTRWSRMTS